MIDDKVLVVFSGGQDSTTCLFWAKREFKEVFAVSYRYGQKHENEVELARKIAEKAGVPFEVMDIPLVGQLGHNSLTDTTMVMDQDVPQTDYSGYPDCRDAFVKSLNVTLNLAMDYQFVLHTPLMWIDKAQTWELADQLGVLDLVRNETLTCYNGIQGDGCGHCPSCKLRNEGLHKYLALKAAREKQS